METCLSGKNQVAQSRQVDLGNDAQKGTRMCSNLKGVLVEVKINVTAAVRQLPKGRHRSALFPIPVNPRGWKRSGPARCCQQEDVEQGIGIRELGQVSVVKIEVGFGWYEKVTGLAEV